MTSPVFERISNAPNLDPIEIFWCDYEPGRGSITLTCYGCAWTAYFGAMGERGIKEFLVAADVGYLVTKLGITPLLKQRKQDHAYLAKIVTAIKAELAASRGAAA